MVKIRKRVRKRKKIYITYEFEIDGDIHEGKISYPIKEYDTFTEKEIAQRIRGAALAERMKLQLKKEPEKKEE